MEELANLFISKRKIAKSSAEQYARTIFRIITDNKGDGSMLNNFDKIKDYIDKQNKITTKRNYITAIIVYLKANETKDNKLIDNLMTLLKDLNNDIEKEYNNGKKTDGQEKQWADWDTILSVGPKLQKKIKGFDKDSKEYKEYYQDYLLYSLYTIISPLRNDYADMLILTPAKLKKIKNQNEINYILGTDKIVINQYKMSKKNGPIIIELEKYPELISILKGWYKINKEDYLLITEDNKAMSPNTLTKRLNKIFKTYLDKNISTSVLRHSYLSSKYGKVLQERKDDAEIMGHSISQQDAYIKVSKK